jgi:hypothetical protein
MLARIEGAVPIRSDPRAFAAAFARRIGTGLFPGAASPRAQYLVTREGGGDVHFRATNLPTAMAAGLNEVRLAAAGGRVRYEVRYPRWAGGVLALSAVIGAVLIGFFALYGLREYLADHPASALPGLSLDQNVALAWGMAAFWGFVWPWILIAMQRRPLRQLIEGLIAEVDAQAAGEARRG